MLAQNLKPFWDSKSQEIASSLILPTEFSGILVREMGKSWFSITQQYSHKRCLADNYLQCCISNPIDFTKCKVTKSKLIQLSPTSEQKRLFKHWTDTARYVYNWTIEFIRSCVNFSPSWMEIRKYATRFLPKWTKGVPSQVKYMAIKEAYSAFWKAKGKLRWKSRKASEHSCFISKYAIRRNSIYPTVAGKNLHFREPLPKEPLDSRLIYRYNKWWLVVPYKAELIKGENQAKGVVALDPGIRTFITYYNPSRFGKIGEGAFGRIYRLLYWLDDLYSKRAKANNRKKKSLTKAIRRATARIKYLINELHWKTARFLCSNFAVILMPTFETSNMVNKQKRKIKAKAVRSMLGFRFYQFKQRLKWVALKMGVKVIEVSEAYTSKTHPETGKIYNVGSSKRIRLLNGSYADRDIVGARNILIKYLTEYSSLVDKPAVNSAQVI